jgi:hypothetical protein
MRKYRAIAVLTDFSFPVERPHVTLLRVCSKNGLLIDLNIFVSLFISKKNKELDEFKMITHFIPKI